MAVLITGGAGYIGSHAAVEFLNDEREIIILDNFYNSCPKSLERIRGSAVKRFHQNSESWKVAEKCALNETEWKNPQSGSESPEHAPG